MKRSVLMAALLLAMTMLTACGSRDNATALNGSMAQQAGVGALAEAAAVEVPLMSGEKATVQIQAPGELEEGAEMAAADSAELTSVAAGEDQSVDLDLTKISGTVVYSQVYDMMMNPSGYMGQRIRVKGSFSYFQNTDSKQEYFTALIADATACCAQGIEFVWKGDHSYPRDYPPLDTEITVTGTFNTYEENGFMYLQLVNADVKWDT